MVVPPIVAAPDTTRFWLTVAVEPIVTVDANVARPVTPSPPVIFAFAPANAPPAYMLPEAPIPPSTTKLPVVEDVEFTFPVTSISLANKEAPIPTPPATTTAPVVVEVELVVLLNVVKPVTPKPPVTLTFDAAFTAPVKVDTPATERVEPRTAAALTVNPPVTPSPPDAIFTLEANDATPVMPRVVLPTNGPTDVSEVWKVEAPVTPMPPEVTNTAAL